MRVEDCIVAVERRSTGGCIDLALIFTRRFWLPIYTLTAWFAIPSCLCVWFVGRELGDDVFLPSLIIFAFFSVLFGGALTASVGPQVFGVPITTRTAMKNLFSRCIPFVFLSVLARMTGFCVVVPIFFVLGWCGHLPEVMFLERTKLNDVTQRLSWLCKGGGYARNLGRITTLSFFWSITGVGIFLVVDVLSNWLFNVPIFFGTIAPGPDMTEAFAGRLVDDYVLMTVMQASFWLMYPVVRIAWFFCYLDQRIRNECWDLELQFRAEAVRLSEVAL